MKKKLAPVALSAPLKLDLGCGPNKRPGFTGIDSRQFAGVDLVLDLAAREPFRPGDNFYVSWDNPVFKPWPWEDDSVDEVHCSHFIEHLGAKSRIHFFNELYRVMRKDAKATVIVPHWSSERAYGDLTHQWPPVVGFFWYYVNRDWRAANAPHVGLTCNFEVQHGPTFGPPWTLKSQETQAFALNHYINAAQDMIATLTARK